MDWLTAIQMVLVLGGLLAAFLLLRLRLGDFGRQLDELRRDVEVIANRTAAPQAPPPPPAPAPPPPVFEVPEPDLGPILEQLRLQRRILDDVSARLARGGAPADAGDRAAGLRGVVERHLRDQGFEVVRVMADLESVPDGPVRIAVEGVRSGSTAKGYLVVDAGTVVEQKLTSSLEVFP